MGNDIYKHSDVTCQEVCMGLCRGQQAPLAERISLPMREIVDSKNEEYDQRSGLGNLSEDEEIDWFVAVPQSVRQSRESQVDGSGRQSRSDTPSRPVDATGLSTPTPFADDSRELEVIYVPEPLSWEAIRTLTPEDRASVTFDAILSNVDVAEETMYDLVLQKTRSQRKDGVDFMRKFVLANTVLDTRVVERKLTGSLTLNVVLGVLREGSVDEGWCLAQFMDLSTDGETMSLDVCKRGLFDVLQHHQLACSAARWDQVLEAVTLGDEHISMERWLVCCRRMSRIVRLAYVCDV
mmetsp:Transcript_42976/g.113233  ORF Transcript_42976/g.113233 Transcript_42976/m.113233 type:complete len:294 (-) Transcript_42976:178-1059(-)